jgi:Calx-beta domain
MLVGASSLKKEEVMDLRRHPLVVLALGAVLGSTLTAAAPTASGTPTGPVKPVIGTPVTVPAKALAGQRFSLSFKVTRSDTGTPLTRGRMICDPSVAGKMIRHVESFTGGTARLALVVPTSANQRLLKVKVTIKAGGQSATRVATFLVRSAAPPTLSIDDVSATEGNAGTTTLSFPVRLSTKATKTVSVSYATSDITAKQSVDYTRSSGTLIFAAGETAKTIAVSVVADTAVEQDEIFTISLFNATNAEIVRGKATGTITNDDSGKSVTAGDFKGATQEGNYVYFNVLVDRKIKGFRVNALPCRCRPGGGWLEGGEDLGDTLITIRPNGTFSVELTWTGSEHEGDVEWTSRYVKVVGSFPTASTAKGTIAARYEFNDGGVHYVCNSWTKNWTATLQG